MNKILINGKIKMYDFSVVEIVENLKLNGYAFLPSIENHIDLQSVSNATFNELNGLNYGEGLTAQIDLIKELGIERLIVALFEYAKNDMKYRSIKLEDRYLISRFTEGGDTGEAYRGHFDSHLFTIVLPINIPEPAEDKVNIGELTFFPNLRRDPTSELLNIVQKLYTKKYANSAGFERLGSKSDRVVNSFNDYRPLIFMGRTTFHGNNLVDLGLGHRISMLVHLFDPSPKFGIGSLLRLFRSR